MKQGFLRAFILQSLLLFVVFSGLAFAQSQLTTTESRFTDSSGQKYLRVDYSNGYTLLIKTNGTLQNSGDLYAPGTDLSSPNKTPVHSSGQSLGGTEFAIKNSATTYLQELASKQAQTATGFNPTSQVGNPSNPYTLSTSGPISWLEHALLFVERMWLQVITGILTVVGWVFDHIVSFSLDNKKFNCTGNANGCLGPTIETLWRFIRDIGNVVIVFSMLYLAIKTIIEGEGFADKKKLANVLLAALLINFSLFFTKAAFTVSNEIALQIRQEIRYNGTANAGANLADTTTADNAGSRVEGLPPLSEGIAATLGVPKSVDYISNEGLQAGHTPLDYLGLIFQYLLMLTFSVIGVSFILGAGAILLLYRYIVFIFLMILAPIGLVCFFIPWLKKYGDDWIDRVKSLTFLAPVYFLSFYVSMLLLSRVVALGTAATSGTFATFTQMAIQALLIFGTLLGTIILPIKVSAAGGEFIGKVGKWTEGKIKSAPQFMGRKGAEYSLRGTAAFGRGTAGRAGAWLTEREGLKNAAARKGFGGMAARAIMGSGDRLQKATFDMRNVGGLGKKYKLGKVEKDGYKGSMERAKKEFEKKQKDEFKKYGVTERQEIVDTLRSKVGDDYVVKIKQHGSGMMQRQIADLDMRAAAAQSRGDATTFARLKAQADELQKQSNEMDGVKKKNAAAYKSLVKGKKIGFEAYADLMESRAFGGNIVSKTYKQIRNGTNKKFLFNPTLESYKKVIGKLKEKDGKVKSLKDYEKKEKEEQRKKDLENKRKADENRAKEKDKDDDKKDDK